MASNILSAFNDHFFEFINDVQRIFPDDRDILVAKNSLIAVRKANPKMIVKIWNSFIVGKYNNEIESGDISFFLNKDYSQDLSNAKHIMDAIDRLREPIKQMSSEEQAKTMKYIQNLTKLAKMCEN